MKIDAQRLRRLREDRVLSQRELAELSGLTQATIWRMENGFTEVHPKTIRKLAEALGVESRELIKKEE